MVSGSLGCVLAAASNEHGLGWLDGSIVGHNLHQAHHREFTGGTEVQRGVYGRMALLF